VEQGVLAALTAGKVPRTSSLDAPTMLLTGHSDAVLSLKFSGKGAHVASGSRDHTVLLWNVHGDCKNYMMLQGHRNAVLDVQWSADDSALLSCSADKVGPFSSPPASHARHRPRARGTQRRGRCASVHRAALGLTLSGSR